jgi:hypothetical protein
MFSRIRDRIEQLEAQLTPQARPDDDLPHSKPRTASARTTLSSRWSSSDRQRRQNVSLIARLERVEAAVGGVLAWGTDQGTFDGAKIALGTSLAP